MTDPMGRANANLLRHDRMIVVNELRSALSSWTDRLTALAVTLIILFALHSSLSNRPLMVVASAVSALAAVMGAGTARMIQRRLDFHAHDGAMAADALARAARRHYVVSVHAIACGVVTIGALIGRPATVLFALMGYLAGAGTWHIARRVAPGASVPRQSAGLRPVKAVLQRPISGALAAVLVLPPLMLSGSIGPGPMAGFIGLIGVIAALSLTMLDDRTVRFMTISGYSATRIIGCHARALLTFLVLTVMACLALSRGLIAMVVGGVVLAALILMTARILAYRVHSKRTADTLIGICAAVTCIAGFAMQLVLPVVVIAILWHLHRRSAAATWMVT